MKAIFPYVLAGLAAGSQSLAESPAERIKDLYKSVPYDLVRASPQVDILAHIEEMRVRRHSDANEFAVPDLDMETVLRESGADDVLMNPAVLEAIAKMPSERAAQVLRMIEDRRAGLDPLQDVPSLSMSEDAAPPESLSLRGWRLDRDADGAPFLQNGEDAASRVLLVPSMILANFGRVMSIQDDNEGFRVTLESGDVLEGEVAQVSLNPDNEGLDGSEEAAGADRIESAPVRAAEPSGSVRPEARPAPTASSPLPPATSLRPRLRPLDLGSST